jgi:tripartite-type tricarboxylate transporter receptor subunit TctC
VSEGRTLLGVMSRRTMVALAMAGSLAAVGALAVATGVVAQENFPSRPVTLVVPFAAGGSTDVVARLLAEQMSLGLGQQVVVENRAGGGGNVGASAVSKADPDGYAILMATVATHALNPLIAKAKPYDPLTDFAPVSLLAVVPNVLVVNPEFPAKDVKGLIALLKADPGKYNYASWASGRPSICPASCSRPSPARR